MYCETFLERPSDGPMEIDSDESGLTVIERSPLVPNVPRSFQSCPFETPNDSHLRSSVPTLTFAQHTRGFSVSGPPRSTSSRRGRFACLAPAPIVPYFGGCASAQAIHRSLYS